MSNADQEIARQFDKASTERVEAATDQAADMLVVQTRLRALEMGMEVNTKITASIGADTAELLDMFRAAKGFFKFAGWVGNAIKWLAGIAAAFVALYAFVKNIKGG